MMWLSVRRHAGQALDDIERPERRLDQHSLACGQQRGDREARAGERGAGLDVPARPRSDLGWRQALPRLPIGRL